jgi:hypothetical protein
MSTRTALAAYEAQVAAARARYYQACKVSAGLPEPRRAVAAEDAAFETLKDMQQNAMRALVASEFAELLKLRLSARQRD